MGAVWSTLETWVWGDLHWIEPGFRLGYFPYGKQWERHHVEHAQYLLNTKVVRLGALSPVGQRGLTSGERHHDHENSIMHQKHKDDEDDPRKSVGKTLLALLLDRPELHTLRVSSSLVTDDVYPHLQQQHRANTTQSQAGQTKLRVECYGDDDPDDTRGHWLDLTQLPSDNIVHDGTTKKQ